MGHEVDGYDPNFDPKKPKHAALLVNGLRIRVSEQELFGTDALLVCTPTDQHYYGFALAVGCDDTPVFIEKPIFDSLKPGNRVHDFTKNTFVGGHKIFVGYNLRYHPCTVQARKWLPEIGAVRWAQFTVGQKNTKYKDHVIINWSHEIDLALHLLGPGKLMAGIGRGHYIADLMIEHAQGYGPYSTIHLDYLTEPWYRRTVIQGDKGRIEIDFERGAIELFLGRDGYDEEYFSDGNHGFDQSYYAEMADFIDFAQRPDYTPEHYCSGEQALRVLQIATEAIGC